MRKSKRLTFTKKKRQTRKLVKDTEMKEDSDFRGLDDLGDLFGALNYIEEQDKLKEERRRLAAIKKQEKELHEELKRQEEELKRRERLKSISKNTNKHKITRKMRKEIDKLEKEGEALDLDNLVEILSKVSVKHGGKKHNKTKKLHK